MCRRRRRVHAAAALIPPHCAQSLDQVARLRAPRRHLGSLALVHCHQHQQRPVLRQRQVPHTQAEPPVVVRKDLHTAAIGGAREKRHLHVLLKHRLLTLSLHEAPFEPFDVLRGVVERFLEHVLVFVVRLNACHPVETHPQRHPPVVTR